MTKKIILFLFIANMILLCLGWIMAFYAYPRLPSRIPLWINFFGQPVMRAHKSPFFFIYPLAQTAFFVFFWQLSKIKRRGSGLDRKSSVQFSGDKIRYNLLKKEYVYLVLIFFNLIFIHLQRSVILLAHKIEKGVSEYYFYSLFGIILILIPYYRLRKKLLLKK